jgi:anti-anti-sigma factor
MAFSDRVLLLRPEMRPGVLIAHLSGTLAQGTYGAAFKLLRELLDPTVRGVVLAVGELEYLSSAGIAALARLQADLGVQGVVLRMAEARPFVVRLIDMVGLHPTIPQDRTVADAVAALSAIAPSSP